MVAVDTTCLLTRFISVSCLIFCPLEASLASEVFVNETSEDKNSLSAQQSSYLNKKLTDIDSNNNKESSLLDLEMSISSLHSLGDIKFSST